jgi:hypothetical protein
VAAGRRRAGDAIGAESEDRNGVVFGALDDSGWARRRRWTRIDHGPRTPADINVVSL